MGLRGCPTVQLRFGEDEDCVGELLGEREGRGLSQLRGLMSEARVATGAFAVAIAAKAYDSAVTYARTRRQGALIGTAFSPRADRVPIIMHSDIRRMLMDMKCKLEGCRALLYYISSHKTLAFGSQESNLARARHEGLVAILTPVLKAYASEQAWVISGLAIQVHGGNGYLKSFVPERCARDSKVLSIWEGTNYIQALDLIAEKLAMGRESRLLNYLFEEIESTILLSEKHSELGAECALIKDGLAAIRRCHRTVGDWVQLGDFGTVGAAATRILNIVAEVVVSWLLVRGALVVLVNDRLRGSATEAAYAQKIWIAKYYCYNVLPTTISSAELLARGDAITLAGEPKVWT
jgi:acyl-CoA dehydrogenase